MREAQRNSYDFEIIVSKTVPQINEIQFIIDDFRRKHIEYAVYEKEKLYYVCRQIDEQDIQKAKDRILDRGYIPNLKQNVSDWVDGEIIETGTFENEIYKIWRE